MSDESKPTLDAIYTAWRAVGADVAGLDWAKFVGHIAAQTPAEAPEIGEVTWQQAADAIEDMDDYARMMVGVDPSGPRETLYRFLEQAKTALASKVQPKGTVSEFTNELGNAIRITIEGPTSTSENVLTPMEAAKLRGALNEHATQSPAPVAEPLGYLSEHTGPEGPYKWQFSKTLAGVYRDTALRIIPVYEPGTQAPAVKDGWQPMETAPRDGTQVLGYCVHKADPYYDGDRLTDYGARVDGLGHVEDGVHAICWEDARQESDGWESPSYTIPAGWVHNADPEQMANPILWMPMPPVPASDVPVQSTGGEA